jgi:hypothetical protein
VAGQQNPDGLAPHSWNQFPFHGLLGDQPDRPPRLPLRRLTTHHRNDALLFGGIQQLLGAASLPLVQGTLQASLLIAMSDPPDRLGRKMNNPSHHRRGLACRQLLQGNGPEHHPNLLNTGPKNLADCFLVFPGHLKLNGAS